jgi:type VI secretion system protein ImpM
MSQIMSANNALHLRNPSSIYFGKIASRGDFVKSVSGTRVIALIDNWVAQGMEMLIADPAWKATYDNAGSVDFLFIAPHKKHTICGSLVPSGDASSRRFPFIAATLFEIDQSLAFLPLSPLVLERHVNHQRALVQHAARAHDATDTLSALNDVRLDPDIDSAKATASYEHFLLNTTIKGLTNALVLDTDQATVRQIVLAIGYLLQPVLTNYATPPQKGLALPLPGDPARVAFVKALWLDLMSGFLPRAEFDLSIFSCVHFGKPKLIITFNGATPFAFRALFEEQAAQEHLIDISQAAWVEDYALNDAATLKLSSYLEHSELSLRQMVETFRQGFTG